MRRPPSLICCQRAIRLTSACSQLPVRAQNGASAQQPRSLPVAGAHQCPRRWAPFANAVDCASRRAPCAARRSADRPSRHRSAVPPYQRSTSRGRRLPAPGSPAAGGKSSAAAQSDNRSTGGAPRSVRGFVDWRDPAARHAGEGRPPHVDGTGRKSAACSPSRLGPRPSRVRRSNTARRSLGRSGVVHLERTHRSEPWRDG